MNFTLFFYSKLLCKRNANSSESFFVCLLALCLFFFFNRKTNCLEKHLQMCFAKESSVQDFKIKAQKPNPQCICLLEWPESHLYMMLFDILLVCRQHQHRWVYQRRAAGHLVAQHAQAGHESGKMDAGAEEEERPLLNASSIKHICLPRLNFRKTRRFITGDCSERLN